MNNQYILPSVLLNFRKWKKNYRIWIVFAFELSIMWVSTGHFKSIAEERSLAISAGFFAVWCGHKIGRFVMFLGILVLFCNAPFMDEQHQFIMIRLGKQKWFLGQMIYMLLASFLYFAVMYIFCVIRFIPYINFANLWGDVLYSTVEEIGIIRKVALDNISPISACVKMYILCSVIGTVLGFILTLSNVYHRGKLGVGIVSILLCITYFISDFFVGRSVFGLKRFSILDWCDIDNYVDQTYAKGQSYPLNLSIIVILSLVIFVLCFRKWKRD